MAKSMASKSPAKPARRKRPIRFTAVIRRKNGSSSFVGFVPANNPRLVSLVLVDEPEGNVYGGVVAAPAFRNIAQGALRQHAVAPQQRKQYAGRGEHAQGELPLRADR